MNTVLLNFQNVCEMSANFRLQNGLNLLFRIWPSSQHPKRRMVWSQVDALYDLKTSVVSFRKMRFLENRKISVSSKISTFSVFFSLVHHAVQMHSKNLLNIWLKKTNLEKNAFLRFIAQKTKHYQITTLKFRQNKVHEHANICD